MLCRDPYAIHRNYEDPWWIPDPIRDTQWTDIDFALVEAAQAVEAFTSKDSGQLRWLAEDPDVYWEIGERVDFAIKEVAQASEKYKDGVPRELTLYPKNPTKDGEFWTLEEWMDNMDKDQVRLDRGAPEGGHAPTLDEIEARDAARAERIRKALEDAEG